MSSSMTKSVFYEELSGGYKISQTKQGFEPARKAKKFL